MTLIENLGCDVKLKSKMFLVSLFISLHFFLSSITMEKKCLFNQNEALEN